MRRGPRGGCHGDPALPSAGHRTSAKSELWLCKTGKLGWKACNCRESNIKHLYKPWLHRMVTTLCNTTRAWQDKDKAVWAPEACVHRQRLVEEEKGATMVN